MTVGKLYGGILIHENWRNTKFGSIEELRRQEAELEELERAEALAAAEDAAKEVADRGKQKHPQVHSNLDITNLNIVNFAI